MPPANRNRVIVYAVIEGGLSAAEAARRFGVTRQWVSVLVARYRTDGEAGLEPRNTSPIPPPTTTTAIRMKSIVMIPSIDSGRDQASLRVSRV